MKYTNEQRIAENRCDECEEVMINEGHDLGGPVICDTCHAKIRVTNADPFAVNNLKEVDGFDD